MRERTVYLDVLRITAILAVIALHVAAPLVVAFPSIAPAHWQIANLFDSAMRFCVPVFFMISGALILGDPRNQSVPYLLRQRVLRVLVPLLAWSLVYLYLYPQTDGVSLTDKLIRIANKPFHHLWFLYTLIGLYLLTPLLGVFAAAANQAKIAYFIVLWALLGVFNPVLQTLTGYVLPVFVLPNMNDPFLYTGYFVLGYYLHRHACCQNRWLIALLIVGGIFTTFWLTDYYTVRQGRFYEYFYRYNTPNVLAVSMGIFLLGKSLETKFATANTRLRKIISRLAELIFGIYLVHIIVIKQISQHLGLDGNTIHPAIGISLTSLCVFLISALFTYLLQRIPLLGKWVA